MEQQTKRDVDEILASLPTRYDMTEYTKKELERLEMALTHALKIVMEEQWNRK